MDIIECVSKRKSIRAFKKDVVPREILTGLLTLALRAPSWANTQPWEFDIVSGDKLEEIRREFIRMAGAREPGGPELASPQEYPEPYDSRRRVLGRRIYELKGIDRKNADQRRDWGRQGLLMFGAPCCIYIYVDRSWCAPVDKLNAWPVFDCGLVAQNIMLLAVHYGLGTVTESAAVAYPAALRRILNIGLSKLIVLGIAIGYPDWADPVNKLDTEREPLARVARWFGFGP